MVVWRCKYHSKLGRVATSAEARSIGVERR